MLWVALERWTNRIASLVVFAIIGRVLSPTEIGLVALAVVVVSFFQMFADQGFTEALVQRDRLEESHKDSAFWVAVGTAVGLCLIVQATAGPIAALFDADRLAPVLRVLSLTMILTALSATPSALLEREFAFKQLSQRRLIANLSAGVLAVGLAIAGAGVWAIVAQGLASAGIGVLFLWTVVDWRPGLRVKVQSIRDLRSVGLGIIGIQFVSFLSGQSDKLIIGLFLDPAALGVYYIAQRITSILLEVQASVIQAVALTSFSRLQNDKPRLRRAFLRFTGTSSAIGVLVFSLFAALAPILIPLIFGDQWERSVLVAQILCVLAALRSVLVFDRSVLVALDRAGLAFKITAVQSIVAVAALLAAAPFGLTALAVGASVPQYIVWPFRMRALSAVVGISIRQYLRQWFAPALAGVATFGVVSLGVVLVGTDRGVGVELAVVAVGGTVGATLYLALGRLLFPAVITDVREIVRERRAKGKAA